MNNKLSLIVVIIFTCLCFQNSAAAAIVYKATGDCEYQPNCSPLNGELTVSELVFSSHGIFKGEISISKGFKNSVFLYDFYNPSRSNTVFSNDRKNIVELKWFDTTPGFDGEIILKDGSLKYDDGQLLFSNVKIQRVQEVPVPATIWLFGSALLGLVSIKRKSAV